eukprot:1155681-Pelagomonas_calceolata.AAC.1
MEIQRGGLSRLSKRGRETQSCRAHRTARQANERAVPIQSHPKHSPTQASDCLAPLLHSYLKYSQRPVSKSPSTPATHEQQQGRHRARRLRAHITNSMQLRPLLTHTETLSPGKTEASAWPRIQGVLVASRP